MATIWSTVDSTTSGFLFADLRGYTAYVEQHGAGEAVELLYSYRAIVRDVIARFHGAEIKTEGDSFYVVFAVVSDAVRAALDIQASAARLTTGRSASASECTPARRYRRRKAT